MQMMRRLYNQMVLEKAQNKAEPLIQTGGIKREKKEKEWPWLAVPFWGRTADSTTRSSNWSTIIAT
jgi:hypothetical protein